MRKIFGLCIGFFGLIAALIGLLAIYDPIGVKMSDDSDPFGEPISVYESIVITLIFVSISIYGFRMFFIKQKESLKGQK